MGAGAERRRELQEKRAQLSRLPQRLDPHQELTCHQRLQRRREHHLALADLRLAANALRQGLRPGGVPGEQPMQLDVEEEAERGPLAPLSDDVFGWDLVEASVHLDE